MKILILSQVDHSGAGYALREAINNHTPHKARAITYRKNKMDFPHDILAPSKRELQKWIRWASVLNVHDEAMKLIGTPTRPIVTTYHGSWYRQNRGNINLRDRKAGYIRTCLTIDLSMYGPKWIGRPVPKIKHTPSGEFTFAHAPSQRHRKGTHIVIKAARNDLRINLIEKVKNTECLRRKATSSVLIDQVGSYGLGYGTNAIEAWAIGIPVISSAPNDVIKEMKKQWGYIPFIRVMNAKDLRREMIMLKNDQDYWNGWRTIGISHYEKYHSPEAVAKRFCSLCTL